MAWWTSFAGQVASSTSNVIAFNASNGTYAFQVGAAGHSAQPRSGKINVSGYAFAASIVFVTGASSTFGLTFTESGLPTGTLWTVTVDGVPCASTTSTLVLTVDDGPHNYTVGGLARYVAGPSNGTVTVTATGGNQSIVFASLPDRAPPAEGPSSGTSSARWAFEAAGALIVISLLCVLAHRRRRKAT
jgi:hypothetical protein